MQPLHHHQAKGGRAAAHGRVQHRSHRDWGCPAAEPFGTVTDIEAETVEPICHALLTCKSWQLDDTMSELTARPLTSFRTASRALRPGPYIPAELWPVMHPDSTSLAYAAWSLQSVSSMLTKAHGTRLQAA